MKLLPLIFTFFIFSTAIPTLKADEFNKALKTVKEARIKKKLKKFKAGGIEKKIKIKNSSPKKLVNAAKKYKGIQHCMGGNGKYNRRKGRECIDCSGLLCASFQDIGVALQARSSQDIARYGKVISKKEKLKKGDLIFFIKTYKPRDKNKVITHSGIVINSKEWIHTSSKKGVVIEPLNSTYWNDKFIFGTRVFK